MCSSDLNPHPDILAKATSPSIGSFGVFYEETGSVELNYSVAELVASSAISSHPRMVINERLSQYQGWCKETLTRACLFDFLSSLFFFKIGSILDLRTPSDRWLFSYVSTKCKDKGIPDFMESEGAGDILNESFEHDCDDGISVLMINSESNF